MGPYLNAINSSIKPVVGVVRGSAIGIGFTQLSLYDFVFVDPDTTFISVFMKTFQSPEGSSTLNFPKLFGTRRANEILMLDSTVTAQEALNCGFVSGILPELKGEPDFFDLKKVPAIGKLLATDYQTLTNCKLLLNKAKDNEAYEKSLKVEGEALLATWKDDEFKEKITKYLKAVAMQK